MKWPKSLTIIRHGESAYNVLRAQKEKDALYQEFKRAFENDYQSPQTLELAKQVQKKFALWVSDYDTPLTAEGIRQARETGGSLLDHMFLPDVVFVSPYLRTRETFKYVAEEFSGLSKRKVVYDDRIREQEHGLSLLYNDWRVFHTFHPEQKKLHDLMGPYWYQYPQGESVSNVRDRNRDFTGMLIREYAGKRVLLVSHHLTILSFRGIFERLSPEDFIYMDEHEKPVNCGVTTYKGNPELGANGKLELVEYNKKFWV